MRTPFILHASSFALLATRSVSGHAFIVAIDGENGERSTGFGARLSHRGGLGQNTGIMFDNEIASGQTTPCGRIFGGDGLQPSVINVAQEMAIAEADGVASARQDGSVMMSVFVKNRDGAGPYTCDYSSDTSLKEMKLMTILTQIEGTNGINEASSSFVYPLTSVFPMDAICRGGKDGNTCIMRCRNPRGFGSCSAIKLFEKQPAGPAKINRSKN